MNLFISPNMHLSGAGECACAVIGTLRACGLNPMVTAETASRLPKDCLDGVLTGERGELLARCDMIVAIGGDGTIFHSAVDALEFDKPILGINSGRLGFLSQIEAGDLSALGELAAGRYRIENRMVLRARLGTPQGEEVRYAINDVVISRTHFGRILDLEVRCGEDLVGFYRADGLIFSTPTGSTAYALSAGGPIVDPALQSILMTPTCPHSLYNRSIVFAPDTALIIRPTMPGEKDRLVVTVDGRGVEYRGPVSEVRIERSVHQSRFVCFAHKNFYQTLHEKLKYRG